MTLNDSDGRPQVVTIKRVAAGDVASFCERQIELARASEALDGEDRSASDDIRTMSVKYAAKETDSGLFVRRLVRWWRFSWKTFHMSRGHAWPTFRRFNLWLSHLTVIIWLGCSSPNCRRAAVQLLRMKCYHRSWILQFITTPCRCAIWGQVTTWARSTSQVGRLWFQVLRNTWARSCRLTQPFSKNVGRWRKQKVVVVERRLSQEVVVAPPLVRSPCRGAMGENVMCSLCLCWTLLHHCSRLFPELLGGEFFNDRPLLWEPTRRSRRWIHFTLGRMKLVGFAQCEICLVWLCANQTASKTYSVMLNIWVLLLKVQVVKEPYRRSGQPGIHMKNLNPVWAVWSPCRWSVCLCPRVKWLAFLWWMNSLVTLVTWFATTKTICCKMRVLGQIWRPRQPSSPFTMIRCWSQKRDTGLSLSIFLIVVSFLSHLTAGVGLVHFVCLRNPNSLMGLRLIDNDLCWTAEQSTWLLGSLLELDWGLLQAWQKPFSHPTNNFLWPQQISAIAFMLVTVLQEWSSTFVYEKMSRWQRLRALQGGCWIFRCIRIMAVFHLALRFYPWVLIGAFMWFRFCMSRQQYKHWVATPQHCFWMVPLPQILQMMPVWGCHIVIMSTLCHAPLNFVKKVKTVLLSLLRIWDLFCMNTRVPIHWHRHWGASLMVILGWLDAPIKEFGHWSWLLNTLLFTKFQWSWCRGCLGMPWWHVLSIEVGWVFLGDFMILSIVVHDLDVCIVMRDVNALFFRAFFHYWLPILDVNGRQLFSRLMHLLKAGAFASASLAVLLFRSWASGRNDGGFEGSHHRSGNHVKEHLEGLVLFLMFARLLVPPNFVMSWITIPPMRLFLRFLLVGWILNIGRRLAWGSGNTQRSTLPLKKVELCC